MNQQGPWAKIPERGSLLGLKFLVFVYRLLGRKIIYLLLHPITLYYTVFNNQIYQASSSYFSHLQKFARTHGKSSPPVSWRSVYKHIHTFGMTVVDKLGAWAEDPHLFPICVETQDLRDALSPGGKGAVLLSGHIGNLEVMRVIAATAENVVVNALMFTKHAQKFNRILSQVNPDSHLRIIPLEEITVATVLELEKCIQRGECVALLADRVSAMSPGRSVPISFLGEKTQFPEGPFILASLLDCPVFFCSALAQNQKYHIQVTRFADVIKLPRKNRHAAIQNYAQLFAHKIEEACLKAPYQWFNFYDYWDKSV